MLIKTEFKVDQFVLKNAPDPKKRLESNFAYQAQKMGMEIMKVFPFQKMEDESYHGELPELALNRDHPYVDQYRSELCIYRKETMELVMNELCKTIPDVRTIKQLLTDEHLSLDSSAINSPVSDRIL